MYGRFFGGGSSPTEVTSRGASSFIIMLSRLSSQQSPNHWLVRSNQEQVLKSLSQSWNITVERPHIHISTLVNVTLAVKCPEIFKVWTVKNSWR